MEIPSNTLEELKCDICQDYLSYGPVFSKNNGFTLCGRCFASEEKQDIANRNLKYEAVARLLKFPCKYRDHGCKQSVPFVENYQEKTHEQICEYKTYECPVVETCDWLGQRKNILEHCQSAHPGHVMTNPCHLMHDIKQFCVKNYVINCFDVLFLLYTKICIATGKIYHAIKLLDPPDLEPSNFKYILDIKRDELVFSRPGKVTTGPEESSQIVTSINMLLELLDGFSGTIFTIKLQKVVEDTPIIIKQVTELHEATSSAPPVTLAEFREALKEVATGKPSKKSLEQHFQDYEQLVQQSSPSTVLKEIIPTLKEIKLANDVQLSASSSTVEGRSCRHKDLGCNFTDTDIKCQKHEEFFCRFRTWCWTCWTPVDSTSRDAWFTHYSAAHSSYTHQNDEFFEINSTGITGRTVFVKTCIGYVNCRYYLNKTSFKIYIWSTALSRNLDKYTVWLELDTDYDNTNDYETVNLELSLSNSWDWYGKVDAADCEEWDTSDFKMRLTIRKI